MFWSKCPNSWRSWINMQSGDEAGGKAALRRRLIKEMHDHDQQPMHWFALVCGEEDPGKQSFPASSGIDIDTYVAVIHGMSLFWATRLVLYSTAPFAQCLNRMQTFPERTDPAMYVSKLSDAVSTCFSPVQVSTDNKVRRSCSNWQYNMSRLPPRTWATTKVFSRLSKTLKDGLGSGILP